MKEYTFCDLDDIIQRLNGGKIQPIGETRYDAEALKRQIKIQRLADILIDDIRRVMELKGNEASIEKARNYAAGWFVELIEMLEINVPELMHISGKGKE